MFYHLDRVLHQAVFQILYPIFDEGFIFDSYSCRFNKGTHAAVSRLESFTRKLSKNHRRNIFALKCDIKKFFDSIDQQILIRLIERKIQNADSLLLIKKIIDSFEKSSGKGLPLGNVTSQLFANIYLNELDQFLKQELKVKYYMRYCDDFVILGESRGYLLDLVPKIDNFLKLRLNLEIHKNKIIVRKCGQGIDFLGYVILPHYRVLRTKTKRRVFKKIVKGKSDLEKQLISEESFNFSLQSYLGILKHCEGFKLRKRLLGVVGKRAA
ncbi:MAG TPA: reverse transcriptase/maturase family protein [Candidatus Paceibacterota bacterium]|nr:reverse transcriptase/maturase family protein [Candidatus Paceibacterota bacterium]